MMEYTRDENGKVTINLAGEFTAGASISYVVIRNMEGHVLDVVDSEDIEAADMARRLVEADEYADVVDCEGAD